MKYHWFQAYVQQSHPRYVQQVMMSARGTPVHADLYARTPTYVQDNSLYSESQQSSSGAKYVLRGTRVNTASPKHVGYSSRFLIDGPCESRLFGKWERKASSRRISKIEKKWKWLRFCSSFWPTRFAGMNVTSISEVQLVTNEGEIWNFWGAFWKFVFNFKN